MAKRQSYPKIVVGDRFGMWTVEAVGEPYISPRGAAFRRWAVRCDCGGVGLKNEPQLRTGQSKHCGCLQAHKEPQPGARFGKLLVLGPAPKFGQNHRTLCACDCGFEKQILTYSLTSGHTRSCGRCRGPVSNSVKQAVSDANRRHGMSKSPEYGAWKSLKGRCLNPNDPAYGDYGARGITVCERWIDSFETFFADMGLRPTARHSIERVNNEKGYSPDNCEWREYEDQNRNRRNTVIVEYEGRSVPLAALAAESPIPYGEVHRRVMQFGWPVHKAITQPLRAHTRRKP